MKERSYDLINVWKKNLWFFRIFTWNIFSFEQKLTKIFTTRIVSFFFWPHSSLLNVYLSCKPEISLLNSDLFFFVQFIVFTAWAVTCTLPTIAPAKYVYTDETLESCSNTDCESPSKVVPLIKSSRLVLSYQWNHLCARILGNCTS